MCFGAIFKKNTAIEPLGNRPGLVGVRAADHRQRGHGEHIPLPGQLQPSRVGLADFAGPVEPLHPFESRSNEAGVVIQALILVIRAGNVQAHGRYGFRQAGAVRLCIGRQKIPVGGEAVRPAWISGHGCHTGGQEQEPKRFSHAFSSLQLHGSKTDIFRRERDGRELIPSAQFSDSKHFAKPFAWIASSLSGKGW